MPNHSDHPPGLAIAVVPARDDVVVLPEGELDIGTVDAVRHKVAALSARGFSRIVLDLRRLSFADSCTIHLLSELEQTAAADGFAFEARVGATGPVHRLLALTGLLGRFAAARPRRSGGGVSELRRG
jgi:anti-anti-sigma factor